VDAGAVGHAAADFVFELDHDAECPAPTTPVSTPSSSSA
jgi:hypothetical protein